MSGVVWHLKCAGVPPGIYIKTKTVCKQQYKQSKLKKSYFEHVHLHLTFSISLCGLSSNLIKIYTQYWSCQKNKWNVFLNWNGKNEWWLLFSSVVYHDPTCMYTMTNIICNTEFITWFIYVVTLTHNKHIIAVACHRF